VKKWVLLTGFLFFFSIHASTAFCEIYNLVWHQTFDEAQIEAMQHARAIIHTSYGDIRLKFFPEVAPNHVYNFIQLARIGFYNKTIFHRVIPGFVIQGGDPYTRQDENTAYYGQGGVGYGYHLQQEFMIQGGDPLSRQDDTSWYGQGGVGYGYYHLKQEFNNKPHERGTLSMARSTGVDSAGCQFFICVDRVSGWDNNYTVFGEVVEGIEVVDDIVSVPRSEDGNNRPLERIEMEIEVVFEAGDVTNDGKVDLAEAIRILQIIAGTRFE
jgi:peptidyl-prolyl cis-trans isomerase B (cyclophilin B)